MTDFDEGWEDFRASIYKACPGIDTTVVAQVEAAFPDEIELTCWQNNKAQQGACTQPSVAKAPSGE